MKTQNNLFARFAAVSVFATLLTIVCFLSVCESPDITISISDDEKVNKANSMLSMYVGYGIDVFSGPTYIDGLKSRLLKNIVYKDISSDGGNSYIEISNASDVYTTFYTSEKITDVYSNLDVHVTVKSGAAVPFFSGGFSTQFSSSNKLKSKAMFYNSIFSTIIRKYTLGSAYKLRLEEIVDSTVYAAVNGSIEPSELFKNFGTHIIISNATGGALNISAVYNSDSSIRSSDLKAALSAKSVWANGNANTNISSGQSAVLKNTDVTVHASGGLGAVFGGNLTLETVWDLADQWTLTISDNPTLSVIYDAVPIWNLATDVARKTEIESYFYNRAKEINIELGEYFVKDVIVHGGMYIITNWDSQKALDATKHPYDDCVGWDFLLCHKEYEEWVSLKQTNANSSNQKWNAVENNDIKGVFTFKSIGQDGYALHATDIKEKLTMKSADPSKKNQKFKVINNINGYVFLRSELDTTYYVAANDGSDGSLIYLIQDTTLARSKWILNKVGDVPNLLRKQYVSK